LALYPSTTLFLSPSPDARARDPALRAGGVHGRPGSPLHSLFSALHSLPLAATPPVQSPMPTWYGTTPSYYVNERPHIGHCYTTLVDDVAARFQRLIRGSGEAVFLLTGTDEHGEKVVTRAREHGVTPM